MAILRRQEGRRQEAAHPSSPQQISTLRVLYSWRDEVAREEDESPSYVLPNHQMVRLAAAMPRTPEQLHAACHPLPPLLQYKASSLLSAIAEVTASSGSGASQAALEAQPTAATSVLSCTGGDCSAAQPNATQAPTPALHASALHPLQPTAQGVGAAVSDIESGAAYVVRHPPPPSRSPPLPPEHIYFAAGWVSGADDLADAAQARVANAAANGDGHLAFMDWSSASSEDDDEAACDRIAAKKVQDQLDSSPLWILSMFAPSKVTPSADEDATKDGAANTERNPQVGAEDGGAMPRSLTEIYKLSNQNKRRGASAARSPEETLLANPDDPGSNSDEGGHGADERASVPVDEDDLGGGDDDDDADTSKKRRSGSGEEASKEATEEFMRRIGWWARGEDSETPTGDGVPHGASSDAAVGVRGFSDQRGTHVPQGSPYGATGLPASIRAEPTSTACLPAAQPPQLFTQQMPPPGGGQKPHAHDHPQGPDGHKSSGRGSRGSHKKRVGASESFDYDGAAANAPFVYGVMAAPSHMGQQHPCNNNKSSGTGNPSTYGSGGSSAGAPGGNAKRSSLPTHGNRAMSFSSGPPKGGRRF